MSPISEMSHLPMISPLNSFTIRKTRVHMRKRAGSLAEISPVRSEIIGRRDENSPYEHASPVTEMKSSVLIGRQFASGRFHLVKRDKISHMKPGHILSHLMGYLTNRVHMNRPLIQKSRVS